MELELFTEPYDVYKYKSTEATWRTQDASPGIQLKGFITELIVSREKKKLVWRADTNIENNFPEIT